MPESQSRNFGQSSDNDEDNDDDDERGFLYFGRPPMTKAEYANTYHQLVNPPSLSGQVMSTCKTRWGRTNLSSFLLSLVPIVSWLPAYNWGRDGLSDLVAGFTVAIMHIPQGMAYGMLAGVDPVIGIYTAFFPVLLYVCMGNMPHVSMGTFAVVSILVSKPVLRLSEAGDDGEAPVYTSLEVATAVAFCVGLIQTVLGLIRMGSLTVVITDVIVSSFTIGASFHVLTSQVKHVLGLNIPTVSGVGRIITTSSRKIHWARVVSLCISLP